MKYYVVGYMYCGKTTFGRTLAAEKGMEFVDLDRAFEERYHYTIPRFFQSFGEKAFRQLENLMLRSTLEMDNVVVSTGGGTPCHSDNMSLMLQNGTVIYLKMGVEDLVQRALCSKGPRPLMKGLSEEGVREKIAQQLPEREREYIRATLILDGRQPELP